MDGAPALLALDLQDNIVARRCGARSRRYRSMRRASRAAPSGSLSRSWNYKERLELRVAGDVGADRHAGSKRRLDRVVVRICCCQVDRCVGLRVDISGPPALGVVEIANFPDPTVDRSQCSSKNLASKGDSGCSIGPIARRLMRKRRRDREEASPSIPARSEGIGARGAGASLARRRRGADDGAAGPASIVVPSVAVGSRSPQGSRSRRRS